MCICISAALCVCVLYFRSSNANSFPRAPLREGVFAISNSRGVCWLSFFKNSAMGAMSQSHLEISR